MNKNFLNNQNYILGKKNINLITLKEIFNNEMMKNKRMAEYDSVNDFSLLIDFVFKICFNVIKILYLLEKKLKIKKEIIFIIINFLYVKLILSNLFTLYTVSLKNMENGFFLFYLFSSFIIFITINTYILGVYFLNKNKRIILIKPTFKNINEIDYIIFKK